MPKGKNVVCIIPARGGSKGLPRKNLRMLAGKPLIAWPILHAKQCKLIDRIIVSTDDEEIAAAAKKHGAEVPFLRPEELSQDLSTTEAALKHCVEWLEEREGYKTDIVVFITCTDIFRKPEWIDRCVQKLLDDSKLESAFVAYKTHKNYWQKVNGKYVRLRETDKYHTNRQVKTPVFREDTGLASATRAGLIKQGLRLGDNVWILENDDDRSFIDVHDEFDLWLAEQVLTEWPKVQQRFRKQQQ